MARIDQIQVGEDIYDMNIVETKYAISDQYSTDEKIIGTWVDGKPIYQKTISYDNSSSNPTIIDVTDLNIDRFIYYSFSTGVSSEGYNQGTGPYYNSSSDYLNVYLDTSQSSKLQLYIRRGDYWFKTKNGYITIQYTKTTDV